MQARLDAFSTELGPKFAKHLISADEVVAHSTLPRATQELMKIRASQINGCGGCLDMSRKPRTRARQRSG